MDLEKQSSGVVVKIELDRGSRKVRRQLEAVCSEIFQEVLCERRIQ